jgi:hypothetical protein
MYGAQYIIAKRKKIEEDFDYWESQIDNNPFNVIIGLGHEIGISFFPDLAERRLKIQERAYNEWREDTSKNPAFTEEELSYF